MLILQYLQERKLKVKIKIKDKIRLLGMDIDNNLNMLNAMETIRKSNM